MASTTCQIEEIPREGPSVPQIRLQIIHLDFNEQTKSFSSSVGGDAATEGSLQQFVRKPVLLKRLHKLQSFDHLLQEPLKVKKSSGLSKNFTNVQGKKDRKIEYEKSRETKEEEKNNGALPQKDEDESVYVVFVKGMNGAFVGDQKKILSKLVHVLNNHAVSVATNEHKLFCRPRSSSTKATLKHICLRTGLLAMNEILDDGGADVSKYGLVGVAQCLALTLCLNKNVASVGRRVWNSRVAQLLSDSWISFGCVAAVVISTSRQ